MKNSTNVKYFQTHAFGNLRSKTKQKKKKNSNYADHTSYERSPLTEMCATWPKNNTSRKHIYNNKILVLVT
jgi:hypothetical protein